MSATTYPVHAYAKAPAEELRKVYDNPENKDEEGYADPHLIIDEVTRRFGWAPVLDDTTLRSTNIWGTRQRDVVPHTMPDGGEYNVLVSWVPACGGFGDTDIPEMTLLCATRAANGYSLIGYEPDGDTLTVTYGEDSEIYATEHATIGIAEVGTADGTEKSLWWLSVNTDEKEYLTGVIRRAGGFKKYVFRKVVAVPDDCFPDLEFD